MAAFKEKCHIQTDCENGGMIPRIEPLKEKIWYLFSSRSDKTRQLQIKAI
jgi:hypothetical protein